MGNIKYIHSAKNRSKFYRFSAKLFRPCKNFILVKYVHSPALYFLYTHRPTFCKYTVGSSFYTTVHTHTVYECVFIVQCTYMYNLQYCTCSIFICRAEGSALAHPPTAPIPNQHARPGVGYICGLWVLPSRYNSQSKRANADCAQFVFPLYSFLFCHL